MPNEEDPGPWEILSQKSNKNSIAATTERREAGETVYQLGARHVLPEDLSSVLRIRLLTTGFNSSSRKPGTLFCPLRTPTHVAYRHIHTLVKNNNNFKMREADEIAR